MLGTMVNVIVVLGKKCVAERTVGYKVVYFHATDPTPVSELGSGFFPSRFFFIDPFGDLIVWEVKRRF